MDYQVGGYVTSLGYHGPHGVAPFICGITAITAWAMAAILGLVPSRGKGGMVLARR